MHARRDWKCPGHGASRKPAGNEEEADDGE